MDGDSDRAEGHSQAKHATLGCHRTYRGLLHFDGCGGHRCIVRRIDDPSGKLSWGALPCGGRCDEEHARCRRYEKCEAEPQPTRIKGHAGLLDVEVSRARYNTTTGVASAATRSRSGHAGDSRLARTCSCRPVRTPHEKIGTDVLLGDPSERTPSDVPQYMLPR